MSKQSLLLVDSDTRSLRVLEVSLRKAGLVVTAASSVQDALDKLELHVPDLIISETTFPDGDGFELRRRVRSTTEWAEIPFIFLTAEVAIENKIRGLELGVDDYLTKPIYIKEIVTRINILLQKRQRATFEAPRDGKTRFAGRVQDMPVVDVIQTIEISRKSGVIQFTGERGRQAAIYFRDGRVIDAEAGTLIGEDAVYRLLTWSEGEFEVVFRTVRRREVITMPSQSLLMEGMRRLDEWSRLLEQIPPLTHRFEVDTNELATRLGDVPDDNNRILRLIDGKRTLIEVIDASDAGDLECLQAISRLYFEELLLDLDHGKPAQRDTGKPMPLVEVEVPTPIEEVASGPIDVPALARQAEQPEPAPAEPEPVAVEPEILDPEPEPGSDAEPSESDVIEEAPLVPLLGNFRPSSLRLIDEAVAAAQAIEPSLFEDPADGNGVPEPVDRVSDPEILPPNIEDEGLDPEDLTPVDGMRRTLAREDSTGLRMIGSLGRDRAEASGELRSLGDISTPRAQTQRELVTILPRRITRETPIVSPSEISAPLVSRVATPREIPIEPPLQAVAAKPVEPPEPAPAHVLPPGTGVHRPSGLTGGVLALMMLAAILAGIAVYLRLRRQAQAVPSLAADAQLAVVPPTHPPPALPDAALPAVASDASVVAAAADARLADAAVATVKPDAAPDKNAEARSLYDKAHDALEEGDFARAFELAEESLRLRKTARTYLLMAQAEQRLDRVDDALISVANAETIMPGYSGIYEVRGRILWSAQRYDEAREAFAKFLELDPNSPKAASIKRLMNEPR